MDLPTPLDLPFANPRTENFARDFTARFGVCTRLPVEARDARRHLRPMILDEELEPLVQCHCPGTWPGPGPTRMRRCILRATQEDAICDACRKDCVIATGSRRERTYRLVKAIDRYGPWQERDADE